MLDRRHRFLDERLAKALSHPVRQRILQRLTESGAASPNELAQALGEPRGNVNYHVRSLRELEYVELVRTEPRRGPREHFYRATVSPWLDDEQWVQLPGNFRRKALGRILSEILEEASNASREGGFDGPEAHVSRVELALDEEAWTQITALLAATLQTALRIHADSASRRAAAGPAAPPRVATALATLHFRHAETH
jgi:DNA-binding transcriptional ArsR family regulator